MVRLFELYYSDGVLPEESMTHMLQIYFRFFLGELDVYCVTDYNRALSVKRRLILSAPRGLQVSAREPIPTLLQVVRSAGPTYTKYCLRSLKKHACGLIAVHHDDRGSLAWLVVHPLFDKVRS